MSTSEGGNTLTGTGDPVHVLSRLVTANFFQVLGPRALRGQTFIAGRKAQSVLLSHAFEG